eukprot:jgi/Psemu1/43477/gm1.43477_g
MLPSRKKKLMTTVVTVINQVLVEEFRFTSQHKFVNREPEGVDTLSTADPTSIIVPEKVTAFGPAAFSSTYRVPLVSQYLIPPSLRKPAPPPSPKQPSYESCDKSSFLHLKKDNHYFSTKDMILSGDCGITIITGPVEKSCLQDQGASRDGCKVYFAYKALQTHTKAKKFDFTTEIHHLLNLNIIAWKESYVSFVTQWLAQLEDLDTVTFLDFLMPYFT